MLQDAYAEESAMKSAAIRERDRGQIEQAATELNMAVEDAQKAVAMLHERLIAVLRPTDDDRVVAGHGTPHAVQSPLADHLGGTLDALRSLTFRVNDLSARIDL